MSDYVQDQEHGMQLAAHEDDPESYNRVRLQEEVDQAIPAPFADITLASLQKDTGVEDFDWSCLDDTLKDSPWRDLWLGGLDDQGAQAQSDDDRDSEHVPAFYCDFSGCKRGSLPYKHKGGLNRHKKSHGCGYRFRCTALECNYSFTRQDKLRDHIRAGHDDETLFACRQHDCQALLTKDLMSVHGSMYHRPGTDTKTALRQCPLPKCSFYVRWRYTPQANRQLDALQQHLLDRYDVKSRKRLAPLLEKRGYHYESAHVVCSVCPEFSDFETHVDFTILFLTNHCSHPDMPKEAQLRAGKHISFRNCKIASPDELREYCRTILSLIPYFWSHPVWEDIRRCPQ